MRPYQLWCIFGIIYIDIKYRELHPRVRISLDRFAFLFRPSAEFARRQRVPRRLVRIVEIERDGDTHEEGAGPCWLAGAFDRFEAHIRAHGRTRRRRDTHRISGKRERARKRNREEERRGGRGEEWDKMERRWVHGILRRYTKQWNVEGEKEWEGERWKRCWKERIYHSSSHPSPSFVSILVSLYNFLSPSLSLVLFPFCLSLRSLPLTAIRELPRVFSYSLQCNQRWHALAVAAAAAEAAAKVRNGLFSIHCFAKMWRSNSAEGLNASGALLPASCNRDVIVLLSQQSELILS